MRLETLTFHAPEKVNFGSGGAEGAKGAIANFVCFHCPLVASAEAKPCAANKAY